ncbi:MAG: response regulator [Candidatus Omnitrophica bacterium]|nr:response regulator [Candidatus Omnitrophota bacterium]
MIKKVLVIDDNEQDRKIAERYLKKSGYSEIVMAINGQEGLSKVNSENPGLVILDTMLPDIVGFEVCQKIKESKGPQAPLIIMMTGAVDAVDAVRARQSGADDYCVKTADGGPLLAALKNISEKDIGPQT